MKKSVRKRKKVSGIVLKKTGNDFMLTKQQFWIWGLSITFLLIFLAFSVDYFSNSASYGYGLDDESSFGVGELYSGSNGAGQSGGGVDRCGNIDPSGDYKGCDECLKCDQDVQFILFTNTETCGPCITLARSQAWKDFDKKYPVAIVDLRNPDNQWKAECYGFRGTPSLFVISRETILKCEGHPDQKAMVQECGTIHPGVDPDGTLTDDVNEMIKCYNRLNGGLGVCKSDSSQNRKKCTPKGWVSGSADYWCIDGNCVEK